MASFSLICGAAARSETGAAAVPDRESLLPAEECSALGAWEAAIRAPKATRPNRTAVNTNNARVALGKTLVAGLLPVSTLAPAAFATPAITDIAPPFVAP